jgi:phage-related protein
MEEVQWKIDAVFFRTDHGHEPVRDWLLGLGDRIARVIFCVEHRTIVLLHGFIKKTQKTPKRELDLAMKRMNQLK